MKHFLTCIIFLLTCSCSLQLGNGQGGSSNTAIGNLPNGSTIYISPGVFNINQGSNATGTINISNGNSQYIGISSMLITTSNGQTKSDTPTISVTPSPCVLNSDKPGQTCSLNIMVGNTVPSGAYTLTITMINESTQALQVLAPVTINVQINHVIPTSSPTSIPTPPPPPGSGKTVTFINKCSQTVWFAIGDASTNAISSNGTLTNSTSCGASAPGTTCPTGSTCTNPGNGWQCFWDVPKPTNGNYKLTTGQSNSVSIPNTSYDPLSDKVWGGVFGARMNCNTSTGACEVGGCTTVNGGADMTCVAGEGLQPPITQAEVTFKRIDTDYYDVEIINGASLIGVSIAPDNPVAGNNPYYCGIPGATTSVNGLPASNWQLTPPSAEYNFVDGSVLSAQPNPPCTQTSNCSGDKVCGYTTDAIAGSSATYKLSCGNSLGYFSALQLYSLNQTSSNTALGGAFNTTQSGSPYSNGILALCANPPLQSGYNSQAPSVTCGCTNWSGIQPSRPQPTSQCQTINPSWTSFVLPTLTWQKQACPTCYTYPFDDKSSSYRCHSSGTSANSMNYIVTFCPNN